MDGGAGSGYFRAQASFVAHAKMRFHFRHKIPSPRKRNEQRFHASEQVASCEV
jgi:hypothetical protein